MLINNSFFKKDIHTTYKIYATTFNISTIYGVKIEDSVSAPFINPIAIYMD